MKLYVVMQGEYSERHIERIFLEEGKAINFCKYHDGSYYDEYETNDEGYQMQKNGYYRCHIKGFITKVTGKFEAEIRYIKHELISTSEYEAISEAGKRKKVQVSFEMTWWGPRHYVNITTFLRESDVSKNKIDDVLEKIGYDTCSEVAALFAEGRSLKQVKEIYGDEN